MKHLKFGAIALIGSVLPAQQKILEPYNVSFGGAVSVITWNSQPAIAVLFFGRVEGGVTMHNPSIPTWGIPPRPAWHSVGFDVVALGAIETRQATHGQFVQQQELGVGVEENDYGAIFMAKMVISPYPQIFTNNLGYSGQFPIKWYGSMDTKFTVGYCPYPGFTGTISHYCCTYRPNCLPYGTWAPEASVLILAPRLL